MKYSLPLKLILLIFFNNRIKLKINSWFETIGVIILVLIIICTPPIKKIILFLQNKK